MNLSPQKAEAILVAARSAVDAIQDAEARNRLQAAIDEAMHEEPTMTITVRMPASLHHELRRRALLVYETSMNRLCVELLAASMEFCDPNKP